MTGRAIQGNIQFEGGSIGPTAGRDNTLNIPLYCPTQKECNNRFIIIYDSNLVGGKWNGRRKGKRKEEEKKSNSQSSW